MTNEDALEKCVAFTKNERFRHLVKINPDYWHVVHSLAEYGLIIPRSEKSQSTKAITLSSPGILDELFGDYVPPAEVTMSKEEMDLKAKVMKCQFRVRIGCCGCDGECLKGRGVRYNLNGRDIMFVTLTDCKNCEFLPELSS